ncbi:MAG: TolC family protein [Armatimonadetes bacterium]|nr:TolC family protein [Armatimonadota bacterium]
MKNLQRVGGWILVLGMASFAHAQETLTLEQALQRAKNSNGDIQAAFLNYEAARQNEVSAFSSYLPSATLGFSRSVGQSEVFNGPGQGFARSGSTDLSLQTNWLLWDDGTRAENLQRARLGSVAQSQSALQVLRNTLFSVHERYLESLRSQLLLGVQEKNVERAKELLDSTLFRIQVEDLPAKDKYQAQADYQNALVNKLTAQNRVSTSGANLKAVLAWNEALPQLVQPEMMEGQFADMSLEDLKGQGLSNRPELISQRKQIESQRINVSLAKKQNRLKYALNGSMTNGFLEQNSLSLGLTLSAQLPVYSGKANESAIRVAELGLEAQLAQLDQSEQNVEAEIEAAYWNVTQNRERVEAAKLALKAAQENYNAVEEAFRLRAATVIERLTAQVTLVTAESNMIESTYDSLISEVRLQLAIGMPMPGEINTETGAGE